MRFAAGRRAGHTGSAESRAFVQRALYAGAAPATSAQLDILALPFELPEFPIAMAWHPRSEYDAGHRWLREQLKSVKL